MNTVNPKEIQNFSKDSAHWWDVSGPFKPLHRLNPVRLSYIKSQICKRYDRDAVSLKPFTDLDILDVGCGGGLVCEPLSRLGGVVTGIDADENAIHVAHTHAQDHGLTITYKATSSDILAAEGKQYDVVLALEIIEHIDIADRDVFIQSLSALCKPDGLIILSTLNRNPKSYALGIVAAEYLLRWVPQGTHDWKKFVKPSELSRLLKQHGLTPQDMTGLAFNPLKNEFHLAPKDLDVNYLISAVKH